MRKPLALVLFTLAAPIASAQSPVRPTNRAEAVEVISNLKKIVTPGGVERLSKIRIGGIDQYVSIRSRDPRNPVLLILHGGPGWVAMPSSWYFARGWDEYFTVIQWDQRGAGKTYVANDPAQIAPTMTIERMNADVTEVVQWARSEFGKQKIFLLGHSWGSLLGLEFARRHPDQLHAYIGAGQGVDTKESERRGWRWTLEQAKKASNAEAIRELESIAPYAVRGKPIRLEHVLVQRKWLNLYGGAAYRRTDASFEGAAIHLSPEYTDEDVRQTWKAQEFSVSHLLSAALESDFSDVRELKVPLILFLGRHDINVSSSVAAEWFEQVTAPRKHLVWFEHSAHEMLVEEPGKALVTLVQNVRPIAEAAGDVAPIR